ncbi:threonine--tRNA ligase [Candidatus Gottesmanbacteria bacterium]|nr:threonine--tRNA ligase [Candidatus Gottesmanbacteria bacterium]
MKHNDNDYLNNLRHSCAHLLAAAVMELWPEAKRTIGPAIENGFYFDFDFGGIKISESDFSTIEAKMLELLPSWKSFDRHELSPDKAKREYPNNVYKHELIDEFSGQGETLSFYKSGSYWDLCRGGHCDHPDEQLQHFKLLSVAGAYWRGDEKNKMLTRIYGTCFQTKEELDAYLLQLEESKKRDHKKLARELDLIVFSELVGSGLPLYTPRGAILRSQVYNYSRQLNQKIGYGETALPGMNRAELFKVSGHYDKYKADMFQVMSHYSEEEYFLKPMNCPQHSVLYGSRPRSYRDLPIRYCDFSVLYRDERPGEINGVLRSRAFTQDDGHCFCREDQIGEEFSSVLGVVDEALKTYGFSYKVRLSLRDPKTPEKYLGSDDVWVRAEQKLREIVTEKNVSYFEAIGEAAIYGPKLDFIAVDSLGREWQLSTIQLDMIMPSRFGLTYVDQEGKEQTPYMIHRAIIGSERFIAILIEHFAGAFPVWLAPVEVALIPIAERHNEGAKKALQALRDAGLRVELDDRNESMQAKIRTHTLQKVPYLAIMGDSEIQGGTVSVRTRSGKDLGAVSLEQFVRDITDEIERKH